MWKYVEQSELWDCLGCIGAVAGSLALLWYGKDRCQGAQRSALGWSDTKLHYKDFKYSCCLSFSPVHLFSLWFLTLLAL